MRHHGTLNFTPAQMNYVLVETWEALKLSSVTITQNFFKKTHLLPLFRPDIGTNREDFLAGTQQSNREKADDIRSIEKAISAPIETEEVRTTDPMIILR